MSRRSAERDDRGSALVEMSWLGLLLVVPLLWATVAVFDVQRGAFAVAEAARAAGRAYALAPDDASGRTRAALAARQVFADHGMTDRPVAVAISCAAGDCHGGGVTATASVESSVRLGPLPDFLPLHEVAVSASHRVPIGRYQEHR